GRGRVFHAPAGGEQPPANHQRRQEGAALLHVGSNLRGAGQSVKLARNSMTAPRCSFAPTEFMWFLPARRTTRAFGIACASGSGSPATASRSPTAKSVGTGIA